MIRVTRSVCLLVVVGVGLAAEAGGILGDAIDLVAPGVGRRLDEVHGRFKDEVELYANVEEAAADFVKRRVYEQCGLPFQLATNAVIAQCSNWDGRSENQHLIRGAMDTLVDTGILDASDFQGIQIRWCALDGAHGTAPDRNRIYLDIGLQSDAYGTASTLAHEIIHSRQYRRLGSDRFKCQYSIEFTECGGCQDDGNRFEKEAYDFEERIGQRLASFYGVAPAKEVPAFARTNESFVLLRNATDTPLQFLLNSSTVPTTQLFLAPGESQVYNGNPGDGWYNVQIATVEGNIAQGGFFNVPVVVYRAQYSLNPGGYFYFGRNQQGYFDVFRYSQ